MISLAQWCASLSIDRRFGACLVDVCWQKAPAPIVAVSLALSIALTACTGERQLMPTPNLYADGMAELFDDLDPELEGTEVEIVYVTDRLAEPNEAGELAYGYKRSDSLAIGTTVIDLGRNVSWEELTEASSSQERIKDMPLRTVSIDEFAQLPPTPVPYKIDNGVAIEDHEVVAERDAGVERLRAELRRRLEKTARSDVYLYIHGYHNTFEEAAFTMAELWHFLGREGLPLFYSWPAGHPGAFGYTYDRESGEFTIYHLKQVIRWLADQPEIENVHILAHSRGTDVALSALRELVIEARGSTIHPRDRLKIKNFVIAAPDLDLQVIDQRVIAERLVLAVDHLTIYVSPHDEAISMAEVLFASPRGRVGTLAITELDEGERTAVNENVERLSIINFSGQTSGYGHSYFRTNPSVSSDLVLLLRFGLEPGDSGRPLEHLGMTFWKIPEGYPTQAATDS